MVSVITTLPKDVREGEEINYEESRKIYKDYWTSCMDSYVGGVKKTYQLSIDKLEKPPEHLNVRSIEEKGIQSALNYYLEMPDPSKKMTLCAMPQDLTKMPKNFEEVAGGKFWMINGQHIVKASKRMRTVEGAEEKAKKFETWDCYVVWNANSRIIRKISAFYNRMNHFQNYSPTWATNIISARSVWIQYGRPPPPKEPMELGKTITPKPKPASDAIASKKWG